MGGDPAATSKRHPDGTPSASGVDESSAGPFDATRRADSFSEVPLVDGRIELALSVTLIAFGVAVILLAQRIRPGSIPDPIGSNGFPVICGVFLVLVGLIQVVRQGMQLRSSESDFVPCRGAEADEPGYPASTARAFAMFAIGTAWALLMPTIGFIVATALVGIAGTALMGVGSRLRILLVPLIVAVLLWLIFDQVFGVNFPDGPVERVLDRVLPNMRI